MTRFSRACKRLFAAILFICLLSVCFILIGPVQKCSVQISLTSNETLHLRKTPLFYSHTSHHQPVYRSIWNETMATDNLTDRLPLFNNSTQSTEPNETEHQEELQEEPQTETRTWLQRTHWESKIDLHSYKYLNNPQDKCNSNSFVIEGFTLLVLVKSAPNNYELRETIRETYIQGTLKHNISIKVVFLLGFPAHGEADQMDINKEANINGDIIQENFQDSYYNLTIKDMMGLKWTMTFCNNSHFVLVTDDDIMIDIFTLVEDLSHVYPENRFVLGEPTYGASPIRNPNHGTLKKFYTPLSLYPKTRYPTYPQGYGYVFSIDVVPQIFQASKEVPPPVPWEDVYIGVLLEKTQINITDKFYWYRQRHPVKNPLLPMNDYFMIQLSIAQMKTIWNSVESAFLR
ncbi:beta-1,3-galactosyltransferase 5-like [Lytechinus variegatus]|uniref:beta-1,3-galactosyltransferase 5-like n=1 Tax=Lytechinus variegatus TaxID=7654 RepID=UPI001BB25624|nr:beta-1,3-galactosyltransferase 5-like [Lytechinus variegatus]